MATITIPNPEFSGEPWGDDAYTLRVGPGVVAEYRQHRTSKLWRVKAFEFGGWDRQSADEWVRAHREEYRGMDMHNVRVKELQMPAAKAVFSTTPTDDDLALINEYALEPLSAEQVYVRRMNLCNDQWDRAFERFSPGVLANLGKSLPGRAVLVGHNYDSAPVARFYRSEVVRDAETGWRWLQAYWYTPRTQATEELRSLVDSGVWSYVSVGFYWDWLQCDLCGENYLGGVCPHLAGELYPASEAMSDDVMAADDGMVYGTVTYRGKADAVEGSIVYLGCQYDAAIVKAKSAGEPTEAKRLLLKEPAASDGDDPVAGGPDVGGVTDGAPEQSDPVSGSGADNPDTEEAETMSDELVAQLDAAQTALNEATKAQTEAVAERDAERGRIAALRAPVVADLKRLGALLERTGELSVMEDHFGEDLAGMKDEKLLALRDEWATKAAAEFPAGRQTTAQEPENPGGKPKTVRSVTL